MNTIVQHKDQHVGVFVDVQNLYYSARNLYNKKVDFKELLRTAVNKRKLIRAIAYAIKADVKDETNFHEALTNIGFEVRLKDLQVFYGGTKKGDWDVGIAMDAIRISNKLDTVILVSGDGDFEDLLQHLKAQGCRVEVVALGRSSSSKLREAADSFTDLESEPKKYLKADATRNRTSKSANTTRAKKKREHKQTDNQS